MSHEVLRPILSGEGGSDYERYLRTDALLSLQNTADEWVHRDELLFQTVHQSSELWLKHAWVEAEEATRLIEARDLAAANRLLRRSTAALKYVDGFHATPRNLTVLVYGSFGLDLPALSEEVKEALTLLEVQTYVQRNGNAYEYLTDEEQEVEQEIKNVEIDASEVGARLSKILTGDVIKANRIRYARNGQDFPFGFKRDD